VIADHLDEAVGILQQPPIAEDDDATRDQREEQFGHREVEGDRRSRQPPIGFGEPEEIAPGKEQIHDVAMLDLDAFGRPRAPGGEQDVGEPVPARRVRVREAQAGIRRLGGRRNCRGGAVSRDVNEFNGIR